ncbi:MAG: mycothiol synthase [Acidimicrobiia bacterium]
MTTTRVLDAFTPSDAEALRVLADSVEAVTGVEPLGAETWAGIAGNSVLGDRGVLVSDDDGTVVAYAHASHHHPDEWSLELATLDCAHDLRPSLVAQAISSIADAGGGRVTLWAHGVSVDDDALAATTGFAHDRDLLQLRVPLPLPTAAAWPDGVTVRTFRRGVDEEAWLPVNNRAFAEHPEQGDWTIDLIEQREAEDWFDPAGFLVAFDDEGMAGFCWTKVHPPKPPREPVALGEIYVIGADPRWHARGLGRALTTGGLESLADRGITVGMLYVDGANAAAVGLYRALGFVDHRTDRAYARDVEAVGS